MGDKGRADLGDTVRQWELETGLEELLDVRAANILGLLDLHNAENLGKMNEISRGVEKQLRPWRTWIERKRARWRAAMSW